jgi:uncharacterized protein YyaL (SSP411 family)
VASLWQSKRGEIVSSAEDTMRQLRDALAPEPTSTVAALEDLPAMRAAGDALPRCAEALSQRHDARLGGFGAAPKFPRPSELDALLSHAARGGGGGVAASSALKMVRSTLRAMCRGGIYDHVAGGFSRYSVDEHWHVPHFEKMTYDNGQLGATLCDAATVASEEGASDAEASLEFALAARGVLDYLRRDMTHPGGGIYSAEDADSAVAPGGAYREGWFYLWSWQELCDALGGAESPQFKLFVSHYGVKPAGNADLSPRSDPHGEFTGRNILRAVRSEPQSGALLNLSPSDASALLADAREKLAALRSATRPRPRLDNKVIAAWNGMAISAFAKASRALAAFPDAAARRFPVEGGPPGAYAEAAARAASFIRDRLYGAIRCILCFCAVCVSSLRRACANGRPGHAHAAPLLLRQPLRLRRLRGRLRMHDRHV